MSRSIGDVYLKKPEFNRDPIFQQFGNPVPLKHPVLTAEPSIVTRKIRPHDLFLIFASDGLWEHLSDEAAVDIVFKNPRPVSFHNYYVDITSFHHEKGKSKKLLCIHSSVEPLA